MDNVDLFFLIMISSSIFINVSSIIISDFKNELTIDKLNIFLIWNLCLFFWILYFDRISFYFKNNENLLILFLCILFLMYAIYTLKMFNDILRFIYN